MSKPAEARGAAFTVVAFTFTASCIALGDCAGWAALGAVVTLVGLAVFVVGRFE